MCGACNLEAVEVTETSGADDEWSGELYVQRGPGATGAQCMCYETLPFEPGRYRITVPVYETGQAALDGEPLFVASQDVDVVTPGAVVVVTLVPPTGG